MLSLTSQIYHMGIRELMAMHLKKPWVVKECHMGTPYLNNEFLRYYAWTPPLHYKDRHHYYT
jgi:hypothetical protein